ncbi:MAG: hypothetical protein HFE63_08455 [Clostridiales bacterium]|nr:hypothetical protein [Clostridiales bacterium]
MKDLIKELNDPSAEYRGHPFWSWNDKLDPEMLRWQIREMKRVGLGGYFMHARGGLITEYLSDDWFNCINACVDEGKKTGMESWSYDENGWPSGFGGGIVSGMGDRYHVRWLVCKPYDGTTPEGKLLGFYGVSDTESRFLAMKIRAAKAAARPDEKIYYVVHEKNRDYVDILNPAVVKAFIKCTYDVYYKKLGSDFGGASMPGFFTDEPQFARCKIPWSYIMPEEFMKTNGYTVIDQLPLLFLERKGYEKFRFDFWKVVNRLYTESFGKQIYDWCEKHNCKFTGHAMMEDSLYCQMACTSGVMPLYEYMHIPGMDWLCRGIASPLIPKQVGSVAKQLGKKLVLSETFALCGWDVSFEELKWIAEWQYLNGINFMCQHLESYSIRGLRKRDYPPSMFYQSPWWDDYKGFNDYFARLGKLVADSNEQADVLLIHPMHTGYITYNGGNCPAIQKYDRELSNALNILSGNHIGYHLGDESIIASHGSVDGTSFKVGLCSYNTVMLPSMITIDASTFALLSEFIKNGGKVYSLGEKPTLVDGAPSDKLAELMNSVETIPAYDNELTVTAFTKLGIKKITVSGRNGEIGCIHCRVNLLENGNKVYFFQNQDRENGYDAKIILDTDKATVRVDLADMNVYATDSITQDGKTVIFLHFEPMQSYTIEAGDELPKITAKNKPALILPLGRSWSYDGGDDNALTLDTCQYILGDGSEYSEPCNILDVMERLLAARANDKLKLRFTFEVDSAAKLNAMKSFKLVSELTDDFSITLNGKKLSYDGSSWWKDKAFKAFDVRSAVKSGINEIIVEGSFYQREKVYQVLFGKNVLETERNKLTYDTELESLYLVGDFSVYSKSGYTEGHHRATITDGGFVITDRTTEFNGGELVKQGYPFFSGRIKLSQNIKIKKSYGKRVAIKLTKPYSSLAKLYVNGKYVKTLMWADYYAEISDFVKPGKEAKITIELIIGNRNLLGPHHNPDCEPYGVAPNSFSPHGNYSPSSWRDRYSFVKVGINEG